MITYDENLDIKRRDPKPVQIGYDIWNILPEIPIQWLEEVDEKGNYVKEFDALSQNFGVGFYNDGSLSCGFEIDAGDPQFLGEAEANLLHRYLEAALTGLDKEDNLQFQWFSLDEDENTIAIYERERDGIPTHPVQTYSRKELIKRETKRLHTGELKSYRCVCFLNIPYSGKDNAAQETRPFHSLVIENIKRLPEYFIKLGSLLSSDDVALEAQHIQSRIDTVVNKIKATMNSFNSCPGIRVKPLNATEYYRILRRGWSPTHWKTDKLTKGKTLETLFGKTRYSLPSYFVLEDIDDRWGWTWKTGKHWHRILSLRIPPEYCDIGYMVGGMFAGENIEIYNSQYSLTIRPTSTVKAAGALQANLKLYKKQYEGNPKEHINLVPIIEDMEQQLFKLMRSEGSHIFQTTVMIHIWDEDPATLDRWEAGLTRTYSIPPLKARFGLEEFNALPYYMGYFTPGFTRCKDGHRDFTYLTKEVATHLPLMGGTDGLISTDPKDRRAPMLIETHRQTLMLQDDFARGRVNAWGGVAVGTTGSGKSMYYNIKIARTLSPKDIIIVLDGALADGSYRAMTQLLGGSYIETGLQLGEDTFSQNPLLTEELSDGSFRKPTPEELNRFTNNIEPMVRERATLELSEPERACITAAIALAFENYRNDKGRVYLHDVAKALRERNKGDKSSITMRSIEMGQHLEDQWCFPNGPYKFFVDRDSSRKTGNLTVYDLKGLAENPTLKGVMVATYLNQINVLVNENLKKKEEDQARIWVIIDEAWSALMDPTMVNSLMGLYRAGRARNISTHCLTQQMADFKKILIASDKATGGTTFDPTNNAILGNSTWFNMFKHDPDDVKVTKEVLNLPENQALEISQLGSSPGKFREMIQYVRLNNGSAFNKVLVRPLPFELSAYTSDVKEKGRKQTVRDAILQEWKNQETRKEVRRRAVDRLEELGFVGAETMRDDQIVETLTVIEAVKNQK
jgi:hypothetical protein